MKSSTSKLSNQTGGRAMKRSIRSDGDIGQTSDKQETLLMYATLKVGEEIYNHKIIQNAIDKI